MTRNNTPRTWRAIPLAIAAVFLGGTGFVLFQDVLEGGAITTSHVLTSLAMLAATAAGHACWPALRAGRIGVGLGLAVLALAGLLYIATMSGARNAEVTNAKTARIVAAETERAQILPAKTRAEAMLQAALAEVAKECGTGKGKLCEGRKATVEVYTAAIKGHNADLARLGPPQTPNAGYRAAADAVVMLGVAGDARDIERRLTVLMPWLAVLITELGAIVFLSLGLGHPAQTRPARTVQAANDDRPAPTPPKPARKQLTLPAPAAHPVVAALTQAGRPLTNDELADAMGVSKGEASKRRREVADLLTETRDGRALRIRLAA